MITAIGILLVGLVLIFLEFFLPGGVMGTAGGILVITSIIMFAMSSGSPIEIILFIIASGIGVGAVIKFALWKIQHGKARTSLYSEGDQSGYFASSYDREAVGKVAIVASDLRPGGHIKLEGKKYLALSQSGYISEGEKVKIIGGQGESLIVVKVKNEEEAS